MSEDESYKGVEDETPKVEMLTGDHLIMQPSNFSHEAETPKSIAKTLGRSTLEGSRTS